MNIKILIKAIFIGIAKVIPGLSGTILMISFNLYDKAIYAITRFFDNTKKNFIFLLNLSIGILLGVILFSNLIRYCLDNHYIYTMSLFIGLILGGIVTIKKEMSESFINYFLIIISFILMSLLSFSNTANIYVLKENFMDIIIFFISGILEAIGTIVPGVSSTALLMLIGIYPIYIDVLSNLLNFEYLLNSINFLLPFLIGLTLGIIVISLIINYLFKYHKSNTFSIILGLSFSTIISLSISMIFKIHSMIEIILCILYFILGFIISNKIN